MKRVLPAFVLLNLLACVVPVLAQSDCAGSELACRSRISYFNSDGSYYRAELFDGESAKLRTTFYSGMVYRIVPCGTSSQGKPLLVEIYDHRGVGVFHSRTYPEKGYYDIRFGATGQYTVEVRFEQGEGCASLLVGYLDQATADRMGL